VYHATVGANTNLLLNIAPNDTGLVSQPDVELYSALGAWITACYGTPLASSGPFQGSAITWKLPAAVTTDRLALQEDQSGGEQVWTYTVQVQLAGSGSWVAGGNGTAIGHKRIHFLAGGAASITAVSVVASSTAPGVGAVSWANLAAFAPC
jgi:alpha-L-fucosidase